MNWQQRSGQIYANILEHGLRSVRAIAIATGIAKSSVHRRLKAISRRHQYPESPLWEHQSGYQWLHRLVWAVVYVFGVKRGIGNETLSEFFHLLRLEGRIGVSPNALQGIRAQIEQQILRVSVISNKRNYSKATPKLRFIWGQMRRFLSRWFWCC